MTRLFVNHALIGTNVLKLCNEINPVSLDELTILNEQNMKKLRQKCLWLFSNIVENKKEQISRWAKGVTWVWAIDQNKNLRITKLKPMHKLSKYQWQPKWNEFFGILLFSRCSHKVPNGFPTAFHFVTFCNVVLSEANIGELIFQLQHLYFWSEYFCMWKSPKL